MGCACYNEVPLSERPPSINHPSIDHAEQKFGLQAFHIDQFKTKLMDINQFKYVRVEEVGDAFKNTNFGEQLLSEQQDTPAKLLLGSNIFEGVNETKVKQSVLSIGLLYASGSTEEKIKVILALFDYRERKTIYTDDLKKVLNQIVTIACYIMPAIVLSFQSQAKRMKARDKYVSHLMKKIFGGNVHVSGKELVEAINDHAKHLFHPSKLRDMLHSHIDENRIKRRERKLKELQAKR